MNSECKPRFTSQELADRIKGHIEELAQATDAARVSTEMLQFLEMCSRFHQYSWCNTWLIMLSCPHASHVAGFRKWQSLNRFVRKGEHGIPILAPILIADKSDSKRDEVQIRTLRGFKVVYVFDVSQTEGEPLPEPPDWKSSEKNIKLTESLIAFAQERRITVIEKVLASEIQGVSKGGSIDLAPEAGTSTLIHELAHELLHQQEFELSMTREEKELEAEAVAFVVGRHFGLEMSSSANYISLWKGEKNSILDHIERIQKAASEIISAVSPMV